MRNRLVALLSAVLVAALWVSPESIAYLCSMDGQTRAKCCCAPEGEHAEQVQDEVERATCCTVERSTASVSPAVVGNPADQGIQLATASWDLAHEHDAAFSATEFVPALARGPPRAGGPPPYLRHCRFLI